MKSKKQIEFEENFEFEDTDERINDLEVDFCTECQEELESIGISKERSNLAAWKANFHNCVTTGKFKGEMCSRIFITAFMKEDVNPEDK